MAKNYDKLVINRTAQVSLDESELDDQELAIGEIPDESESAVDLESEPESENSSYSSTTVRKAKSAMTPPSSSSSKKFKKETLLWLIPVGLLIISWLVSYFFIFKPASFVVDDPTPEELELTDASLLDIAPGEPKTEPCPLNGQLFTKTEREAWEQRRPVAVMVENTPDARPQSGLSKADLTFEVVAEGGITRFMPIFFCAAQANDIVVAPVRSARTYYINLASGFNRPLYAHVGGANVPGPTNALGQLEDYGWAGQNDLNQFSIGYPTFVRNYSRIPGRDIATEHTMETTTEGLWAIGAKRGWTNMSPALGSGKYAVPAADWAEDFTGWDFVDGAPAASPDATKISYSFWTGQPIYDVSWAYDAASNIYTRTNGGQPAVDINNNLPLTASNVIIMLVKETGPINDEKHMIYEVIGTGDALIFNNGTVTQAKWNKANREAELTFADAKGGEVQLVRGQIWISVIDKDIKPSYQ